jgi:N-acetyl-anhydromuramyl-L-alanine amidase AmpD
MTGSSKLIAISKWNSLARANVIFVHGLGGHPYDTWRNGRVDVNNDGTFWPKWIAEDVPGLNVYSLGYSASPSGWHGQTMPIEDRALELKHLLCRDPALATLPLIFVCHSLGGIIVKRVLLNLDEDRGGEDIPAARLLACVRRVVFLATPHRGAGHASFMDYLRGLLWPTSLTIALSSDAAGLRQINNSYKLLTERRNDELSHTVLHETWGTLLGKIVAEGSADPGLRGALSIGMDANHFGIAKPPSRDHQIYMEVLDAVVATLGKGRQDDVGPPAIEGGVEWQNLEPYDNGSSIDYFGLVLRVALCAAILGAVYFLWPNPASPRPNEAQIWFVLPKIENKKLRLEIAETVLGPLTPQQKDWIANITLKDTIRLPSEMTEVEERGLLVEIEQSPTREDVLANIARVRVASCKGSEQFKVRGDYLACADGTPVTVILSKTPTMPLTEHKAVVFHFTASASASGVLKVLTGETTLGVGFQPSAHLFISREGEVIQLVPFDRRAIHAGKANSYSIGITLSNAGLLSRAEDGKFRSGSYTIPDEEVYVAEDNPNGKYWQTFTAEQIKASEGIVRALRRAYPGIVIEGHSEVDNRRFDPGPAFPMSRMRATK